MSDNPRALPGSAHATGGRPAAVGLLCQCRACQVLPPKPEPLYPRHSHGYVDEMSDPTDAEMDALRQDRDDWRCLALRDGADLAVARLRIGELERENNRLSVVALKGGA